MTVLSQAAGDWLPAPASQPRATDQNVGRHPQNLLTLDSER
jgi:hypothetical protein